jgi:hypothetical protein
MPGRADTADTNETDGALNRSERSQDQSCVQQFPLEDGTGEIAMMTELDAIAGSDLVTMVFVYGSAAMLIVSMAAVTWLCRSTESGLVLRARTAS